METFTVDFDKNNGARRTVKAESHEERDRFHYDAVQALKEWSDLCPYFRAEIPIAGWALENEPDKYGVDTILELI